MSLSSLNGNTFKTMQQLAPFGYDNPTPVFATRGVKVEESRCVGGKGEHLKLKLRADGVACDSIGFRMGQLVGKVTPMLDIVFKVDVDLWGGGERLQLNILDFAPAA
jgi:single-stranded-DNA-specific exonuclease